MVKSILKSQKLAIYWKSITISFKKANQKKKYLKTCIIYLISLKANKIVL